MFAVNKIESPSHANKGVEGLIVAVCEQPAPVINIKPVFVKVSAQPVAMLTAIKETLYNPEKL